MLRKLFVFVICLMAAVATASAQTPPYNEIWYTTTDGRQLFINSGYKKSVGLYMYSDTYNNGRGVLKFESGGYINFINSGLFDGNDRLKSIAIPNSVTSIGYEAFKGCSSLKSITIPNSVTEIGHSAFLGCSSLTSITIPNSVTSISWYAFYGCSSLKSITIPNSVTSIGDYTFYGCRSLTSITIPNSVKSIGDYTFYGCSSLPVIDNIRYADTYLVEAVDKSLTSYSIKKGTRFIGSWAFARCSSLTSITIPNSVKSIEYGAFRGCSSLKSITIPNSVTSIGWCAFYGCSGLNSITIPNSVTSIGHYAFYGCSGLTSITIPNSVTSIGWYAFSGCSSLKSITIPNSVTSIGDYAFWGCNSLTSITIPNSVTSIGESAFNSCSSLTSITIPNSVTSIGESAFAGCSSLKSITIPNSVTSIGECAFISCSSLKSFKGKFASSDGRYLIKDGELIAFAPAGLTSYTIPESVTSIGRGAFIGCSSLKSFKGKYASSDGRCLIIDGELIAFAPAGLTSYTIPNSVTSIGLCAFWDCSSLTSITIPNSVKSIGDHAFYGCSSLTSITIPNSVKSIEYGAFRGCSSLKSFKGKYASSDGRCLIIDGELIAFAPAGLTSYTIPNSVTSIGHYAFSDCSSLTSITIPNSVTSIGDYAFAVSSSLKSITIPNSVTSIGWHAFAGCSSLKSVKVASEFCYDYFKKLGVSDITFAASTLEEYEEAQKLGATKFAIDSNSKYASKDGLCLINNGKLILFIGKDLTEYTIPESVTSFGEETFKDCSNLKSVKVANKDCYDYFKDKVANIAFYGANASDDGRCLIVNGGLQRFIAKGITEYTIPESVTSIDSYAFEDCSSLKSVKVANKDCYDYFKDKVANIAFYGANASDDGRCLIIDGELKIFIAKGITEYTIPNSVTSIGDFTFAGCNSLTSITIPNSVTSIGWYAFFCCISLKSITISNSVTYIRERAFSGCRSLTSITIPESVTSIGEETFRDCSSLTSITCLATTPPAIDDLSIAETTMIYVPKKGVKAYKKGSKWSIYKKQIKAIK